jgi:hypothetical protein
MSDLRRRNDIFELTCLLRSGNMFNSVEDGLDIILNCLVHHMRVGATDAGKE